jgi:hypothetical protein
VLRADHLGDAGDEALGHRGDPLGFLGRDAGGGLIDPFAGLLGRPCLARKIRIEGPVSDELPVEQAPGAAWVLAFCSRSLSAALAAYNIA